MMRKIALNGVHEIVFSTTHDGFELDNVTVFL
jgi:hypothetical protein